MPKGRVEKHRMSGAVNRLENGALRRGPEQPLPVRERHDPVRCAVLDQDRGRDRADVIHAAEPVAHQKAHRRLMTATQAGRTVNRMLHVDESCQDLLDKLEAGNVAQADEELAPLAEDGEGGAQAQAQMLRGGIALEQGRNEDAAQLFEQVAANGGVPDPIRQEEVKALLDALPVNKPLLHPVMASRFQKSVMNLADVLNQEDGRAEASEHLRGLVDKVVLTPKADEDSLRIDLYGDLAGILNTATGAKDMKNKTIIERLELSPSNDNSPQALQDRIGSGGQI